MTSRKHSDFGAVFGFGFSDFKITIGRWIVLSLFIFLLSGTIKFPHSYFVSVSGIGTAHSDFQNAEQPFYLNLHFVKKY